MNIGIDPFDLHTDRLHLTPPVGGDGERITALCQDQEIARWTTVPSPFTQENADEFIDSCQTGWEKGNGTWTIRRSEDGELIGCIALEKRGDKTFEVGYWMGSQYRGSGYMEEALRHLLEVATEQLGAVRIEWSAQVDNWASWRVAWKCGFRREGTARSVTRGGRTGDHWKASYIVADATTPATPWDGPGPQAAQGPALDPSQPAELVAQFHRTYSVPNRLASGLPPTLNYPRLNMRMGLIAEEFAELVGAVYGPTARQRVESAFTEAVSTDKNTRDVVEAADALADLVYVIYGMAIESGINLDAVLAEVQASNLSKLMPDGTVKLREDGKVMKGPDFFPPNIARALNIDEQGS